MGNLLWFLYGLVLFLTGFAALLSARTHRASRVAFARYLHWVAAFAMLVGTAKWAFLASGPPAILAPLAAAAAPPVAALLPLEAATLLHDGLMLAGHGFLLLFGLKLISRWERPDRWLSTALVGGGLAYLAAVPVWRAMGASPSLLSLLAAYGLGLPGAMLSARGLLLQSRELSRFYPRPARALRTAGWAFVLSVPVAPLAVPAGAGAAAIPTSLLVAGGTAALAWSLLTGLDVLRVEQMRRLEQAERREAALEERYRLSRELSDGVIQDLFAAGMLLGAVSLEASPKIGKDLRGVHRLLQETVDRLRAHILDLDPFDWDEPDLIRGLERLAAEFRANTLLPITLNLDPGAGIGLEPGRAREVYVIVHEALSNLRRHSGATSATLSTTRESGSLVLTLTDNGRGIAADVRPGSGIDRMRRTADSLGAQLELFGSPEKGTTLRLALPLSYHATMLVGNRS